MLFQTNKTRARLPQCVVNLQNALLWGEGISQKCKCKAGYINDQVTDVRLQQGKSSVGLGEEGADPGGGRPLAPGSLVGFKPFSRRFFSISSLFIYVLFISYGFLRFHYKSVPSIFPYYSVLEKPCFHHFGSFGLVSTLHFSLSKFMNAANSFQ